MPKDEGGAGARGLALAVGGRARPCSSIPASGTVSDGANKDASSDRQRRTAAAARRRRRDKLAYGTGYGDAYAQMTSHVGDVLVPDVEAPPGLFEQTCLLRRNRICPECEQSLLPITWKQSCPEQCDLCQRLHVQGRYCQPCRTFHCVSCTGPCSDFQDPLPMSTASGKDHVPQAEPDELGCPECMCRMENLSWEDEHLCEICAEPRNSGRY